MNSKIIKDEKKILQKNIALFNSLRQWLNFLLVADSKIIFQMFVVLELI
jgi:hypothetical protein